MEQLLEVASGSVKFTNNHINIHCKTLQWEVDGHHFPRMTNFSLMSSVQFILQFVTVLYSLVKYISTDNNYTLWFTVTLKFSVMYSISEINISH